MVHKGVRSPASRLPQLVASLVVVESLYTEPIVTWMGVGCSDRCLDVSKDQTKCFDLLHGGRQIDTLSAENIFQLLFIIIY